MEGSSLSDEQEFVHYYALPFVSNPSSHPTFKSLFQVKTESLPLIKYIDNLSSYLSLSKHNKFSYQQESWSRRLRCDVCEYIQVISKMKIR